MTSFLATEDVIEHRNETSDRIAAVSEKIRGALDRWLVPGGNVEVHVTTLHEEDLTACTIWSSGPGMTAAVREHMDLEGASRLEVEQAIRQADHAHPLVAVATADWAVEHEDGMELAVLEMKTVWS